MTLLITVLPSRQVTLVKTIGTGVKDLATGYWPAPVEIVWWLKLEEVLREFYCHISPGRDCTSHRGLCTLDQDLHETLNQILARWFRKAWHLRHRMWPCHSSWVDSLLGLLLSCGTYSDWLPSCGSKILWCWGFTTAVSGSQSFRCNHGNSYPDRKIYMRWSWEPSARMMDRCRR